MHYRLGADTNVLFSGLFFDGGPNRLLGFVLRKEATLFLSQYVVDELREVIARKKAPSDSFHRLLELSNARVLSDDHYASKALFSEGKRLVRDKMDVPVFAFAAYLLRSGLADYFVTGDDDLLTGGVCRALEGKIISPSAWLELAEPRS